MCCTYGYCYTVQLTGSISTSLSTSGPTTPIRFTPVPASARMSARTPASSTRHAGVDSRRCKGALSTSTSSCAGRKHNRVTGYRTFVSVASQQYQFISMVRESFVWQGGGGRGRGGGGVVELLDGKKKRRIQFCHEMTTSSNITPPLDWRSHRPKISG